MAAIMSGLDAEAYDRQYNDKALIQRILSYFRPHRRKVISISITTFILSILGAALPIVIAQGVTSMEGVQGDNQLLMGILIGVVFFVGVATWGVNWIRREATAELISDIILAMRSDAFTAAAHQDLSFYDEFSSGRIVSRITSDTEEFGQVINLALDMLNQLFVAVILIVWLFTIDIVLTLAVLALAPFVAFTALGFRRLARRVTQQSSRVLGEVNKSIQEAVTGIGIAKNFRQEAFIYEEFKVVNQQSYGINLRRGFVLANIFPVLNTLSGLATAGLVYYGGRAALAGVISLASWYLFVATTDRFWFPVINLSSFWSQFQAGLSACERVFGLMDVETAVKQTAHQQIPNIKGEITFRDLSFRYTKQEQVLNKFSLRIAPGESVAFVGHTGAGKSSIIKLISRFYEFQEGELFIDGVSIRALDLPTYRRQLGIVSQVPFLFDGTVAENIRYGNPEIDEAEIMRYANLIGNGEWLETLPNGLHSPVGERGSRLSMGQRQLVALMRVLVHQPRIFILDEATASIDPFTESQIQQALDLIMKQTTAIIIAHRLSTVRAADRIVVLSKGQIIEQGSHETLLEADGHYAELYDTYFRHQSLEYIERRGSHYLSSLTD